MDEPKIFEVYYTEGESKRKVEKAKRSFVITYGDALNVFKLFCKEKPEAEVWKCVQRKRNAEFIIDPAIFKNEVE